MAGEDAQIAETQDAAQEAEKAQRSAQEAMAWLKRKWRGRQSEISNRRVSDRVAATKDRATQPFDSVDTVLLLEDNLIAQLQVVVQGAAQDLKFLVRNGGTAETCMTKTREVAEQLADVLGFNINRVWNDPIEDDEDETGSSQTWEEGAEEARRSMAADMAEDPAEYGAVKAQVEEAVEQLQMQAADGNSLIAESTPAISVSGIGYALRMVAIGCQRLLALQDLGETLPAASAACAVMHGAGIGRAAQWRRRRRESNAEAAERSEAMASRQLT